MAPGMAMRQYAVLGPLRSGSETRAFLGCEVVDGQPRADSPVVIVWLPEDVTSDPKNVARLQRETAFVTQLRHPNLIRVYGLECFEEGWARVVSFVDGEPLQQILSKAKEQFRPLDPRIAARMVVDVCEGVQFAHDEGQSRYAGRPIVHGGIRPDTLIVGFGGRTMVTGFGASVLAPTQHGVPVQDKFVYFAPEQIIGGKATASPATDVYAIGAVLYELIAGHPPYAGVTDFEKAVLTGDPPHLEATGLTGRLANIVKTAMAKRGVDRFDSVELLKDAILQALKDDGAELPLHEDVASFVNELLPLSSPERRSRHDLLQSAQDLDSVTILSRPAKAPEGVDELLFEASRPGPVTTQHEALSVADQAPKVRIAPARDADTVIEAPLGAPVPEGMEDNEPTQAGVVSAPTSGSGWGALVPKEPVVAPPAPMPSAVPQPMPQPVMPQPYAVPAPIPPAAQTHPGLVMSPLAQPYPGMPMQPGYPVASPAAQTYPQGLPAMGQPYPGMPQGAGQTYPQGLPAMPMMPPGMVPVGWVGQPMPGQPMPGQPMPQQPMSPAAQTYPQGLPAMVPPGYSQTPMPAPLPTQPPTPQGQRRNGPASPEALLLNQPVGLPPPPRPVLGAKPKAPMRDESAITQFNQRVGDGSRAMVGVIVLVAVALIVSIIAFPKEPPPGIDQPSENVALPKELVQAALQKPAEEEPVIGDEPEATPPPGVDPAANSDLPIVAPPAAAKDGALSISSDPNVDVFNGNDLLGRTPLSVRLPVGKVRLRFTDKKTGINAYRTYRIKPAGEHKDSISFGTSQLVVRAPDGALVTLNAKTLGKAPLDPITIYEGEYLLRVTYEGMNWSERFDAPAGQKIEYKVRLGDNN